MDAPRRRIIERLDAETVVAGTDVLAGRSVPRGCAEARTVATPDHSKAGPNTRCGHHPLKTVIIWSPDRGVADVADGAVRPRQLRVIWSL
jgi:hypothetical protein